MPCGLGGRGHIRNQGAPYALQRPVLQLTSREGPCRWSPPRTLPHPNFLQVPGQGWRGRQSKARSRGRCNTRPTGHPSWEAEAEGGLAGTTASSRGHYLKRGCDRTAGSGRGAASRTRGPEAGGQHRGVRPWAGSQLPAPGSRCTCRRLRQGQSTQWRRAESPISQARLQALCTHTSFCGAGERVLALEDFTQTDAKSAHTDWSKRVSP